MDQKHDFEFYLDLLTRHQYAFFDRMATPEDMCELFPFIPLVPDYLRSDAHRMPGLLPLAPDAPYMEHLAACMTLEVENPSINPVATLIEVSPDVNQRLLEIHLTSRLIVYSPQGKAYLRYYSSDIFPHLVRVLSPERLKSLFGSDRNLLGRVQKWTYRFQDEWITVPAPEVTKGVPIAWTVLREQREALNLVDKVDKALDAYQTEMGRPWNDYAEWNEKACAIELSLDVAQRIYHLSDTDDLATFAMQALTHGERFYSHPRIHSLLRHTAPRPGAYSNASYDIKDDEWIEIAAKSNFHSTF